MRRTLLPLMLLLTSACGIQSQPTPEPSDTELVDKLVKELGVERTYNSQTLLPNPDPDGLVLMHWMDRRRATLAGALGKYQVPASTNPGTIAETLAWERETERAEDRAEDVRRAACGDHPCPIEMPPDLQWSIPTSPTNTF